MKILLVDDHSDLRAASRDLLEAMGHQVIEAAGGEEALDAAGKRGESFELLATDLSMPGMDGIELADRLVRRLHRQHREISVLLISSNDNHPGLRFRLAAGDVAFLRKPFSRAELEAKIEEARQRKARPGDFAVSTSGGGTERADGLPSLASLLPPRKRWAPAGSQAWGLGLAAMLALAVGASIVLREPVPPILPAPPPTTVSRGTELELADPVGPIAALPAEFLWAEVEGTERYEVALRGVDDAVLWRGTADSNRLRLPAELAAALHPAVAYDWRVEALDESGRRIAWSERTRFRWIPPATAESKPRP